MVKMGGSTCLEYDGELPNSIVEIARRKRRECDLR